MADDFASWHVTDGAQKRDISKRLSKAIYPGSGAAGKNRLLLPRTTLGRVARKRR